MLEERLLEYSHRTSVFIKVLDNQHRYDKPRLQAVYHLTYTDNITLCFCQCQSFQKNGIYPLTIVLPHQISQGIQVSSHD